MTHLEGDSGIPGGSGTELLHPQVSLVASPYLNQTSRPSSPAGMSSAVKELIQRQETYIEQLEKEAAFCRDQLSNILLQVKQVLLEFFWMAWILMITNSGAHPPRYH